VVRPADSAVEVTAAAAVPVITTTDFGFVIMGIVVSPI
jgi:hypothetical protein